MQGFCFFRSFDRERQHGAWLERGKFLMLGQLTNADWGNPRLRHFTAVARGWEQVCITALADGYFRHAMFKMPEADLWAWALEWNGRLRIFGLYGDPTHRDAFVEKMPTVRADFSQGDTTNGFFVRVDTPIAGDEDDLLFALPEGFVDQGFAAPHWR